MLKQDKYKDIIIDSLRVLVQQNRVKVYGFVIMPNHIHLIWQINQDIKEKNVQRDFLKYIAQKIKFDFLLMTKNVKFKVDAKDRRYPRLTARVGDLGKKSIEH